MQKIMQNGHLWFIIPLPASIFVTMRNTLFQIEILPDEIKREIDKKTTSYHFHYTMAIKETSRTKYFLKSVHF